MTAEGSVLQQPSRERSKGTDCHLLGELLDRIAAISELPLRSCADPVSHRSYGRVSGDESYR